MPPHYHYSHGAEPGYPGFDVDLGPVVTIGIAQGGAVQTSDAFPGLIAAAATGDTAQSSIILDDPYGNLGYGSDSIVGLHRFYMTETLAASSDNVAFNGYINAREYRRGESMGITPVAAARRITVDLSDDNAILRFRLATGSDANRPAERAGQRLTWLLGTNYLGGVNDHGLVAYPCNAMDATNYQGQYGGDILADIAVQTGYNYWARYRQASSDVELWFNDSNASTNDTCGLQISNVAADIDNTTTFAPSMDAVLRRDPSKVYAGVYLPYAGSGSSNSGVVYVGDYNIAYQYGWRDGVAPNANIHTRAQATAAANQLLSLNRSENDLVTVGILLDQSLITSVKQGQRMQVKFSHLPGYESWQWCRILRKTIARPSASDTRYLVTLEMTPQTVNPCDPTNSYPAHSTGPLGGPGSANAPFSNTDLMGPYYFSAGDGFTIPSIVASASMHVNYPQFEWAMGGAYNGSWVDGLRGASANAFWVYCQGDGTLDLYLAGDTGAVATIYQDDFPAAPLNLSLLGATQITLQASGSMAGPITKYSFHVTSIGAATCYHLVRVEIAGPFDNGSVYFDHFTWTPL